MGQKYEETKQPKEMFRISEVAQILGISQHNVYVLIEKEKLPYIRFGRKGDGNGGEFRIILSRDAIRTYSVNRNPDSIWNFGKDLDVSAKSQNNISDENDE